MSRPTLGLSSLSWVVRNNVFLALELLAPSLESCRIRRYLNRCLEVGTFPLPLHCDFGLSQGPPWGKPFPPPAQVLLVCPLGNGVLPWNSHVLLAKHPTAMWPYLKQLWHNWAFLITCRRSSKLFSIKILHFAKGWAALHTGQTAYPVVRASLWPGEFRPSLESVSWALNLLPRPSGNVALLGWGLRLWLPYLSRATHDTQGSRLDLDKFCNVTRVRSLTSFLGLISHFNKFSPEMKRKPLNNSS